jgi:C1A family cysteine protease
MDRPDNHDHKKNMNKIKDQGSCGSCWAFSAIGAVEGSYYKNTGKVVDLSEQLLVSCNTAKWIIFGNRGCSGGLMDNAFDWMKDNDAALQTDYPYTALDDACDKNYKKFSLRVTSYQAVPVSHEALVDAIFEQPIAVAVQADQPAFRNYKDGISTGCNKTQHDHGVVAVGFGFEIIDGKRINFYLIRNSWGTRYGEDGFIRLAYGDDEAACGINMRASYPYAI